MTDKLDKENSIDEHVVNPHDKIVKEFLSEIGTAESFFREYLPKEITAGLDFSTLELSKESFVDKKLSEYFSDLLYEVKLKDQSIFIYLLIEHKSWPDRFTAFQLLKYMVRVWELYLKQHKKAKTLPVIVPIVIYHGAPAWKIDADFISLFEEGSPEHLRKYIPDFFYEVLDISHFPDEEIKGVVLLKIFLMALKYIFNPDLKGKLEELLRLFWDLKDKTKATEYLEALLRYLAGSARNITQEELEESVTKIFIEGGNIMATIAEKWLEEGIVKGRKEGIVEGIEKGRKEGIKKGKIDIVRLMKNKGLPLDKISEYTGLSRKEIERVAL